MEKPPRKSRVSEPPNSTFSMRQRRSGYEPSDTETEWQETPRHERDRKNGTLGSDVTNSLTPRTISPMTLRRHSSRFENEVLSRRRHHSKSPYKPSRADDDFDSDALEPKTGLDMQRAISPLSKQRHKSPYKQGGEELNCPIDETVITNKNQNHKMSDTGEKVKNLRVSELNRAKPNYSRRSITAPRQRVKEKDPPNNYPQTLHRRERTPSPLSKGIDSKQTDASHLKSPSVGEINEMIGQAKISKGFKPNNLVIDSFDSITHGDIFFSRECNASSRQKTLLTNNDAIEGQFSPIMIPQRSVASHQRIGENGRLNNTRGNSSSTGLSRITSFSSSAASRKSNGKISIGSSKMSDASGKTTESMRKFTANRKKSPTETWFGCMRKGPCRTSKSPENRPIDEYSYIEKASVVENLRQFWADKHQPASLNGFTCHKQEAQVLKQLVSQGVCPHILFKGPSGSGKRALTMALLREIYGDACWNPSHDLRYFQIQERRPMQVMVPITSSSNHVELNVKVEPNAKYALMGLVKEISSEYAITPEVSNMGLKADYKVIVLYEVDKAAENILHLIKWIIDCYSDVCKLILCCEDDVDILESVKNRCKIIKVDAPVTHEITEVLIQIARKEEIDLSMNFAAKVAKKSKQDLRKAIMALEACKAHNYPFSDDQPISLGWEEILIELAAEILGDPSHTRLFSVRGKFQKLLVDFVHPKLILQKLVEQFLKRVDASLRRELFYWHAYYEKRLPAGTTALLKLEEFVTKFMSIYRKSSGYRHRV
ncbi:Replication factor C subunit 3 [Quillaja saponaria]|uniref:Replication factor C subunit 3 n=1 Tax=Quillaja saponaria TaxID=32244 RepID=A0AAD7KR69_QUISA|nr:Replication factor C subunit 3 [Quillaja saponaria]